MTGGKMNLTDAELESRLGAIVDMAVSARTYTRVPLPPPVCLEALTSMLDELCGELRVLYVDSFCHDPWENHPKDIQP
jgi:hypothetical protein